MMTQELTSRDMQMQTLCDGVRKYAKARDFQKCVAMICETMGQFPNAPVSKNSPEENLTKTIYIL